MTRHVYVYKALPILEGMLSFTYYSRKEEMNDEK